MVPAASAQRHLDQHRAFIAHRRREDAVEALRGFAAFGGEAEAAGEADPVDARIAQVEQAGGRWAGLAGAGADELDAEDAVGVVGEDDDRAVEVFAGERVQRFLPVK